MKGKLKVSDDVSRNVKDLSQNGARGISGMPGKGGEGGAPARCATTVLKGGKKGKDG